LARVDQPLGIGIRNLEDADDFRPCEPDLTGSYSGQQDDLPARSLTSSLSNRRCPRIRTSVNRFESINSSSSSSPTCNCSRTWSRLNNTLCFLVVIRDTRTDLSADCETCASNARLQWSQVTTKFPSSFEVWGFCCGVVPDERRRFHPGH
jgi:hypothetical protein